MVVVYFVLDWNRPTPADRACGEIELSYILDLDSRIDLDLDPDFKKLPAN